MLDQSTRLVDVCFKKKLDDYDLKNRQVPIAADESLTVSFFAFF
jgi:hypothetical protein